MPMQALASLGTVASYAAASPNQAQAPARPGAFKPAGAPTVSVASASQSFSGYGDLILATASSSTASATTKADGDEGANGRETNDGDADDMAASPPSVSFSDAGTYSVSVAA